MKDRIVSSCSVRGDELTLVEYRAQTETYWKLFLNREEIIKTGDIETGLDEYGKIFDCLLAAPN